MVFKRLKGNMSDTKTITNDNRRSSASTPFAGRYNILDELGKGGMGVVYRAEDTRLKRLVALKFLPEELTRDQEAKKRFMREAQAAAALDHPNICTVHEIDEAEGKTYISMACIKGQSLKERISSESLRLEESTLIALQIAGGLQEAHSKSIVHRDIKPANIMLTEDGQIKVMDFGIAKRDSGDDLTKPATILGTVAYMSPEQARGREVDLRTDIWSFGVVFYEMLCGKSPFKGGNEQGTLYSILNEEPEPILDTHSPIPKIAEDIVNKCLRKEPAERYQTTAELLEDLRLLAKESGKEGISDQTIPGINKAQKNRWIRIASILTTAILIVTALAYVLFFSGTKQKLYEKPRLVVLPFENLGSAEDEYFADGMTEEITSRLAKISALGVISRTSAALYAGTEKSVEQIREELDVDFVLGGTVRWASTPEGLGRVKITPELIQTSDDTFVWTDSFDRVVDDVFEIQNDIAQKVVDALGITLLDSERDAVVTHPTESIEAYQAFLRGRYLAGRPHYTEEVWAQVVQSFQQAAGLDPEFGLAYAELAKAHARVYFLRSDLSENRLYMAQAAAHKALELAPDSPEARLALSYYFLWGQRDNEKALQELEAAAESMPDNPEILFAKASIFEILGRFEDGIVALKKAIELSPLDVTSHIYLAGFYWVTRQYTNGLKTSSRAIELGPEEAWTYLYKIFNSWSASGATRESRAVAEAMPQDFDWALWTWFWQEVGEGEYQAALDRLAASSSDEWIRLKTWSRPKAMFKAFLYDFLNEPQKAREAYEKSKSMLEEEVLNQPDDPRAHSSLGVAYAALGLKDDAIRHGKQAADLLPYSENAFYGVCYVQDLALIYLLIGDYGSALDQIEFLLSVHSWISIPFLEMSPYWRRLQDHPRFQELKNKGF
jgi:non-specific serine/threonine protein kinase